MKKILIIAFVVVSAVAAAATIKGVNTEIETKQLPTENVETPRTAIVSNWD
jgi:archaellin